jgi:hypothetical protein
MDRRSSLSTSMPRPIFFVIFGLIAFASSFVFVYLGWVGWPGLHWDAALYGTPVINVASGKGWIFGSYGPVVTRLWPDNAYNLHGILHVFIYGVLFRSDTWSRYILSQGIVNSVTFFVYAMTYAYLLVRAYGVKLYCFITALLLGTVAGVICIGLQGRPEQLAPIVLILPLASFIFISRRTCLVMALGISMAVMVVLSPLPGVFFAVLTLFYLYGSSTGGLLSFFRDAVACLVTGFLISVLLIWILSPVSPLEWYVNVFRISHETINFEGLLLRFSQWWGLSLIAPLWNMVVLILIALAGVWLWRSKRSILSMFLFALSAAYFNEKSADYGYAPFIPFALALCLLESNRGFTLRPKGASLKIACGALWIASLAFVDVLAKYLFVVMMVPRAELSAVDAQLIFAASPAGQALGSSTTAIGFPSVSKPSMVILGDASAKFVSFNPSLIPLPDNSLAEFEAKTGLKVNWMVLPQTVTAQNSEPPESIYVGSQEFILVDSNWVSPLPSDLRFRPSHLTNRYNFATYQRQAS